MVRTMETTHYDITLRGGICGAIWWPMGAKCGSDLNVDLSREIGRITGGKPTLRDVIELVMCEKGGDFQNALLTADTEIAVTAYRTGPDQRITSKRTRYWPVTAFPSIADYVDAETHTGDFCGCDE
jgi:hypothetical protein